MCIKLKFSCCFVLFFSRENQFRQLLRDLVLLSGTFAQLWENVLQYPADQGWIHLYCQSHIRFSHECRQPYEHVFVSASMVSGVLYFGKMCGCGFPELLFIFIVFFCVFKVLALWTGSSIIPNLVSSRERRNIVGFTWTFGKTPTLFPQPVWYYLYF